MARTFLAALLLAAVAAPSQASPVPLQFREAGYLAIDGAYYVFGLPRPSGKTLPASLFARGGNGFDFQAMVAANACTPGSGNAGAVPPGSAALRHAEDLSQPLPPGLALRAQLPARLEIVACDGAVVVFADTASGTTQCSGAIAFPFRRGSCPALDAADAGYVFFNAFEG